MPRLQRVSRLSRPLSPLHQPVLIHALFIHRPTTIRRYHHDARQTRFTKRVQSYVFKKEAVTVPEREIRTRIRALRLHNFAKPACRSALNPCRDLTPSIPIQTRTSSISARRLASLQNPTYREPPPVLSLKTPLPNLISPSNFPSPFTPASQVLHTPFQPPEPHKGTPKRYRESSWRWSPLIISQRSPKIDENTSPTHILTIPDSPICDLTRRFSLVAPPTSHNPRRLSYSQTCTSPWTPDSRRGQNLASPVLLRSVLWSPSSPIPSPSYQLDEIHFSPFQVPSF